MQAADRRVNELESLAALKALEVLDTEPEEAFQALVQAASAVCEVPISLISLIDEERQWFKANVGLPGVVETPRELAFCAHAVLGDELFEVPDATLDRRFHDNPLVAGRPDIRFYAGAPVTLSTGERIGTVCVIDRQPRQLTERQRFVLEQLALAAGKALEGRAALRKLAQQARALAERERALALVLDTVPSVMIYWDRDQVCRFANRACEAWFGRPMDAILGAQARDVLGPVLYAEKRHRLDAALRGEPQRFEQTIARPDGSPRHSLTFHVPDLLDGEVVGTLVQVTDITSLKETEQALRREAESLQRTNWLLHETAQDFAEAQRLGRIGSWEWDLTADMTTWSRELYRITGRQPGSTPPSVQERLKSFMPGSRERLAAAIADCRERGIAYALELEFRRHSDGEPRWIDARGAAMRDAHDAIVAVRGTVQDITDQKRAEQALRKSQEFLERTGTLAGVGGWEVDLASEQVTWSPEICRIHGVPTDYQPTLEEALAFYEPASQAAVQQAVRRAIEAGEGFDLELAIVRRDGEVRGVRVVGSAEMREGATVRLSGASQDVTERRRLAQKLAEQHELLRVTLQSIGDAVITTDQFGQVTWLNPVAERMTGWLGSEALGRPVAEVFHLVHEESREVALNPVQACLAEGRMVTLAQRSLLVSRDGSERGIEDSAAPIRNDGGDLLGAVLVFHDVSEQRRLSSEMTYRATHDSLTGLVNRAEFDHRLERTLAQSRSSDSENALLYIDLDQFKLVNDSCGHAVGDELLQQVSRLLREAVRSRDTLARLGGDEFAILLTHCNTVQARRVAQTICDRMDVFRFLHGDRRFRVGASIGLAPLDRRWANIDAAKQAADAACFAAKEGGRNRVHEWLDTDAGLRARHGQMQWAARIENAIDNDEFVLFGQRMQALSVPAAGLHAEVLLRLRDEDGSLIPPGAFLPAAERFHLATRIDRWVVTHAVRWLSQPEAVRMVGCLHVNLSGQSVSDRAFHAWVHTLLMEAGDAIRSRLCFEITETSAVTHMADAALFVDRIRAVGVRVALDDFGAGASSFGYLKKLRVDYLKIDGQFIRDLVTDPLAEAAVRCFIDVSRVMGLRTVAEFVEEPAVMARLADNGVHFAQGYLVHRPSPIDELLD
ncbi:EAL domain-containing protein [Xylophilus sp. GOD-11R]|uniref:EAL domain-containing protein n=1 Tax=Xylophilus sp. GOD-11R TaxID=3089814 RepID=UPI00298C9E4B|nr:EAL domain-containing protein [Xylophilus sp. GOD-11R]WPB56279.1 EAL domain-containing protein [Xylophilus sp. GOD-11R]